MEVVWILVGSGAFVMLFLILWLRERRRAQAEYVAYGLRADEDDENTKTNITEMEASFVEAITKLEELGEVHQDNWGTWVWTKTGKPLGKPKED